jgi:hypothetical protein
VAVGKIKSASLTVVKKITNFDLNFCSQNILKPNFICNERGDRHARRVCKPYIGSRVVNLLEGRGVADRVLKVFDRCVGCCGLTRSTEHRSSTESITRSHAIICYPDVLFIKIYCFQYRKVEVILNDDF